MPHTLFAAPSRRSALSWACLALARLALQQKKQPASPSDTELSKLFARQKPELQKEIIDWFVLEAQSLAGFYFDCLRLALRSAKRDPSSWSQAPEPTHYDPEVHAPGQAARRVLGPRSSQVQGVRKRLGLVQSSPLLISNWSYNYALREPTYRQREPEPADTFRNALNGFAPGHDLAEALLERLLDDGAAQSILSAFGHSYTSREGDVYSGITLYDAWSSGREIEMPDVDCLGILHEVENDWESFRAPVPDALHDQLYERIAQLFQRGRDQRELRRALAQCYLRADAELLATLGPHLERFHALWERAGSDPAALAQTLPQAGTNREWLERVGKEVESSTADWQNGLARKAALSSGAVQVRERLLWVLRELGVLAK